MTEISLKKKLAWQCRRGMLELDVILLPFLDQHFDSLPPPMQQLFSEFLEQADPDLYSWLMGYAEPTEKKFIDIIERIKMRISID